ncbi:MAG: phosphoribosylanthranilate isomerase [Terrimicrobiaceae bacterium]|nr:phosphoribosylanthranilate isomerase [Terrimicrobiaceae bacterium]
MAAANHDALFGPGRLRVKICGVTNAADAALAVDAGADAIGINLFAGSKRFVQLDAVAGWVRALPVTRVAVVVNATRDELMRIAGAACFDAIQFHGDETPEFCAASPLRWIRAVRVSGAEALAAALACATPTLLLDGCAASGYGGTGVAVDPALAAEFVRANGNRRVILAGGLRPETVAAAVRAVRPHGVDVAGGVERAVDSRRKDAAKLRAFIEAARGA